VTFRASAHRHMSTSSVPNQKVALTLRPLSCSAHLYFPSPLPAYTPLTPLILPPYPSLDPPLCPVPLLSPPLCLFLTLAPPHPRCLRPHSPPSSTIVVVSVFHSLFTFTYSRFLIRPFLLPLSAFESSPLSTSTPIPLLSLYAPFSASNPPPCTVPPSPYTLLLVSNLTFFKIIPNPPSPPLLSLQLDLLHPALPLHRPQ